MTRLARFFMVSLLLVAAATSAQDHPRESDTVRTRGGHKAYRKEFCQQHPYRTNDANFEACVASVQKVEAERKRSAPDLFYTPHDLACGHDRDKYLCAMGNSWACKLPGDR